MMGGLPPLEDMVKNQLTGFAPDVLNEVASRLKLKVKVKEYQNRLDMMQALQRNEIDVVMNMSPTFSGAKYLRYSQPYGDNDLIIISARDNRHILDHSDLAKASVAVVTGSPEAALIPDVYPAIRLHEFPNQAAAMLSVEQGETDAFIGNRYTIRYYIALNKSEAFRTVGNAYLPLQTLRFAFPRENQLLATAFDVAITDMGWREQQALFEKWVSPLPRTITQNGTHQPVPRPNYLAKSTALSASQQSGILPTVFFSQSTWRTQRAGRGLFRSDTPPVAA
jgi:two-component system, NarL family, sensor histidine kinase EvgS